MGNIERELGEYVECDGSADCEAHEHIEGCYATSRPSGGEVERLRSQLAGAVGALLRYGTHLGDCAIRTADFDSAPEAECTCGYGAARAALGGQ